MAGNMSRNKGATANREVVKWLRTHGLPFVEKRIGRQAGDDVIGVPDMSPEVKNHAKMSLGQWIDQSVRQAAGRLPIVIHKRKGKTDVGEWFLSCKVSDFFTYALAKNSEGVHFEITVAETPITEAA